MSANGKLFAFDQDADAQKNLPDDQRIIFVPQNFRHMQRMLRLHKVTEVDGILADLGVSSHQFDEGDRGFSIRFSGPLDMRMDRRQGATAADIIRNYSEQQLHKLFEQYGEVSSVKIVTDRETGRSRGFGFIEMPNDSEGKQAVAQLNGVDFNQRNLVVNEARPSKG